MPKQHAPLQQLKDYLPDNSYEEVIAYLNHFKVELTITRERKSVLGDYRNAHSGKHHRISVNGNLNPYAFLITLLHELAHLLTYERFGHRVQAHGKEWKNEFSKILAGFMLKKIFPDDIYKALLRTLHNPAASSCADVGLLRVLRKYDEPETGKLATVLIESLPMGASFYIKGGRAFRTKEKLRKRIQCVEISTGKLYLFSPVYEVVPAPVS
ncbi:MAG: SprT-like domain-containing protein [Ferruginibacter sp.]